MSVSSGVALISMELVEPIEARDSVIAYFGVESSGIQIKGCLLIQRRNGRLFIAGPKNRHSSVTFRDDALRAAVLAAACNAYQALGGTLLNRVDDDSGRDDEGIVRFCRANVGGK
jgi:hypothetical protein